MRIEGPITKSACDVDARKRPVNLTLNEKLVNRAQGIANNLSGVVETLLAECVAKEESRQTAKAKAAQASVAVWNEFAAEHGSFADEHSTL